MPLPLIKETLQDFTRLLASRAPTPGGGSAAAVEAALGCGLIRKVALITRDKAAFALRRELMDRAAGEAEALRLEFLALVDEDSAAYEGFVAAGREGAEARERALEPCIAVPRRLLQATVRALRVGAEIAEGSYPGTASDLGLAALSLKTAAYGAYLTVLINLKAPDAAGRVLLEEAEALAGAISEAFPW